MRETTCEDFETFKLFLVFIYQMVVMFSNVKVFIVRRFLVARGSAPPPFSYKGLCPGNPDNQLVLKGRQTLA